MEHYLTRNSTVPRGNGELTPLAGGEALETSPGYGEEAPEVLSPNGGPPETLGPGGGVGDDLDELALPRLFAICLDDEDEPLGPDEPPQPGEVVALGISQDDEALAYRYDPDSGRRSFMVCGSPERALRRFGHAFGPLRVAWL